MPSYFSIVPNVEYNLKPIEYPFSEDDFVLAKNFFKKFKVNSVFDSSLLYQKYNISDGYSRLEQLSEDFYGSVDYDWVIVLTNRMINPQFDFPMSSYQLQKHVEKNYENPQAIRHYEIISNETQEEEYGRVLWDQGTRVDETFYNTSHEYWNGTSVSTVLGSDISDPVTYWSYEYQENEKRREIYMLRPRYLKAFIEDMRRQSSYKKSSSFVNSKVKKANK